MKTIFQYIGAALIPALILSGCSLTRESLHYRDEYFRPVTAIPQQGRALPLSSDMEQLGGQLQVTNKTVVTLLDSLHSFQHYTGSLLAATHTLVTKVNELELRESIALNKQKELEQNVVSLQAENKDITQQLNTLRKKLFAGSMTEEQPMFSPARITTSLRDEYSEGVSLFQQKKYEDALATFDRLLDHGIEESLTDNCEYWRGECHFAKHDYYPAIQCFQKVLTINLSNKKPDAYFMLGKSYEHVGDVVKARWAYEELSLLYPQYKHIRFVKARLNAMQPANSSPSQVKQKKAII